MENTQETVNHIEEMSTQQSSEAYSSIDNNLFATPIPDDQTENFNDDNYCENCLRKQSQYLIENYGDQYKIEFTNRRSDEIKKKKKMQMHYSKYY